MPATWSLPNVAFILPSQLAAVCLHRPASHSTFNGARLQHSATAPPATGRPPRRVVRASQSAWPSRPSSALHRNEPTEEAAARYVDLRTMNVINASEAHLETGARLQTGFDALHDPALFAEMFKRQLRGAMFSMDTIGLSDSQQDVVFSLLTHRSVILTTIAGDEKEGVMLDLVMRNRVWKECVVYCASTRRAAESFFATLCMQLGPERRNEVLLDLGNGPPFRFGSEEQSPESVRVVITLVPVLKRALVTTESKNWSWAMNASILVIDHLTDSNLPEWEEVLLALPTRTLVCAMVRELGRTEKELFPLWLETIQNTTVSISPPGASTTMDRIEEPERFPLLRTFAYNAASHESPVQVSLTILKDMMKKELDKESGDFVPNYAESFLHGITMIPAEKPSELLFGSAEEAEFADVAAVVAADAKRTCTAMRAKHRRRTRAKGKERTPASRAHARRRRESAYSEALLLPAIVFVRGHARVEAAARGTISALGTSADLIWDLDTKEHVDEVVEGFRLRYEQNLTDADGRVLDLLKQGIGIVHARYTPSLRVVVEELFRSGFVPLLIADTYLGSAELCALPSGTSVLVESEVMATCDDENKGLIVASTPVSLAGRVGKDDVGNLIMMWYHEATDDETAGHEIASNLLLPVLNPYAQEREVRPTRPQAVSGNGFDQPFGSKDTILSRSGTQSLISTTYDNVLRSLRRFGVDGYENISEYGLRAFRGWTKRGALHATLEKLSVEKKAIDNTFNKEDWESIADYSRRVAKVNEVERVYKAMTKRYEAVRSRAIFEELKSAQPGRIIGVRTTQGMMSPATLERTISGFSSGQIDANSPQAEANKSGNDGIEESTTKPTVPDDTNSEASANGDSNSESGLSVTEKPLRETMSAAVFVSMFDQQADGKHVKGLDSRYLAICIFADGTWTMVPLYDVIALSSDEDPGVENIDLLMLPHPATFDVDPATKWAKCAPIDETEQAAVHRTSDDLIARMAGENRPQLDVLQIPEFEAQKKHMEETRASHQSSPWYGREEEMNELRRLRRRSAELADEIKGLKSRKDAFENELTGQFGDVRAIQKSLMAVLEDCHAIVYKGEKDMEMTPIGALASELPCRYPVFAGACLSLIDDMETLSPSKFAAFVAIVICDGQLWSVVKNDDEDEDESDYLDVSNIRKSGQPGWDDLNIGLNGTPSEEEGDDSNAPQKQESVLPDNVRDAIVEIQRALHQLHRRHLSECQSAKRISVPDIVPQLLNNRLSDAVCRFAEGASWPEVVSDLGNLPTYALGEVRRVCEVLHQISADDSSGDFSDQTRETAREAFAALSRWPVRDIDVSTALLESGVVERLWPGNTYDRWWRANREEFTKLSKEVEARKEKEGESVEAEVVEMP